LIPHIGLGEVLTMHLLSSQHFHLAQVNVAKLRAPLDHPDMADFVAQIRDINAIADADPGFIWRLRAEGADDATDIRAFDDEFVPDYPHRLAIARSTIQLCLSRRSCQNHARSPPLVCQNESANSSVVVDSHRTGSNH
jgi:hypothetical protein